jgi:hypothetical protein
MLPIFLFRLVSSCVRETPTNRAGWQKRIRETTHGEATYEFAGEVSRRSGGLCQIFENSGPKAAFRFVSSRIKLH